MTELYLHLGHGKTGTTYLQNALALSADRLLAEGIAYPLPERQRARIEANHARINGGNGGGMLERYGAGIEIAPTAAQRLVFSSELLFEEAANRAGVAASFDRFGREFDAVHALLFVRDPVDFATSAYQQVVKRHGYAGSLDAYLQESIYVPRLAAALDELARYPSLKLRVHNYSRSKARLIALFEDWLGLERGFLTLPGPELVNRSLTAGELRVQRAMNRVLGKSGNLFADRVCQLLPNRRAARLRPGPEALRAFHDRHRAEIEAINALLPEEARLALP